MFRRTIAVSVGMILIHSMNFASAYDASGTYIEGAQIEIQQDQIGFIDDDGYLIKYTPSSTDEARYLDRKEVITHEVQSGETLSKIAYIYGLNMNTLYWANQDKIRNINALRVEQELKIPVTDGYEITIKSGDTLETLAKKYKGDIEKTKALTWNQVGEEGTLTAGKAILIVDGQPYYAPVATGGGTGGGGSVRISAPPANVDVLPGGAGWIKPTSGSITQWYHAGHYAIDIANGLNTAILAAADGVVVEAYSDGGWHGGYGNKILIQHSNGCSTLYAHNNVAYVAAGQTVAAGQVIAAMGRTGRVYGRTGIHLHVELICNGVKQNPKILFGL